MNTGKVNDLMEHCFKARFEVEQALDAIKDEPHNSLLRDDTETNLRIALRRIKSTMSYFEG